MKTTLLLFVALIIVCTGCASSGWNKNPLRGLTEKQSDWFERRSDNWRF